jgi:hypothetical protein
MGATAARAYLWSRRGSKRHRKETEVNRPAATAIAVAAKPSPVNVHRLSMLGLNLGLWTLIVVIARAL